MYRTYRFIGKYLCKMRVLLLIFLSSEILAQKTGLNIKGRVIDIATQMPLEYATVSITNVDPMIGTTADNQGNFLISDLPMGRYDIQASHLGYEPVVFADILVTGTKEVSIRFELIEATLNLREIVIKPTVHKEQALNPMSSVSARMLSVEEASRYAGGFDDPARLASVFAGVASSVNNNAIVIRGNAPKFLQWKLEGVEIPNPNHFANLGAFGGGGLTALSSNLLANSDFFTGAFPAEYNNALSGVLDLQMRDGNNSQAEHSLELGLIGIDFGTEGPLQSKRNGSYLINYRYSTLGLVSPLLPDDAQGTNYQDLSFKLRYPTTKAGVFTFWGLGLIDRSGQHASTDPGSWIYPQDVEAQDVRQYMGAMGFNHRYLLSKTSYLNSTIAFSTSGLDLRTKKLDDELMFHPHNSIDHSYRNLTFKTFINKRFSKSHMNRTGFTATRMGYYLLLQDRDETSKGLHTIGASDGSSHLLSMYSSSSIRLKDTKVDLGINGQFFTLNGQHTLEPRVGIMHKLHPNHEISLGYGLHSRLEPINTYFIIDNEKPVNKQLGFTKAHHIVLGYTRRLPKKRLFKIEPYYQILFDIPILEGSETALINEKNDWFISGTYLNQGFGTNYGIDLTFEQYLIEGFYYLVTGSIFESKYRADRERPWRNTRFNQNFLANVLVGKEVKLGKRGQDLLSLNVRLSYQGGERFSRISPESDIVQNVIYDQSLPFTEQDGSSLISHLTVSYKWQRPKTTQSLSLKVINLTGHKEFLGHKYNLITGQIEEDREALLVPNLSYRISF